MKWSDALSRMADDNAKADDATIAALQRERHYAPPMMCGFAVFAKPFEKYFACGSQCLNLNHPITTQILRVAARLNSAEKDGAIKAEHAGRLADIIRSLSDRHSVRELSYDEWKVRLSALWAIASEAGLGDFPSDAVPTQDEFIAGSLSEYPLQFGKKKNPRFGRPLER